MKYLVSLSFLVLVGCFSTPDEIKNIDIPITESLYEESIRFADERARVNELSGWISKAGAIGAMIGFLAFVFVPSVITPKWVSAVSIPMSVSMSIFGHRLIEWLGTDSAGIIVGISCGFVLVNALAYFAWKLWWNARNRLRAKKESSN